MDPQNRSYVGYANRIENVMDLAGLLSAERLLRSAVGYPARAD